MEAEKFQAECSKVIERVRKTGRKVIITKRNVPIAELVPIKKKSEELMKGTIHFLEDIIKPIGEEWDANRSTD